MSSTVCRRPTARSTLGSTLRWIHPTALPLPLLLPLPLPLLLPLPETHLLRDADVCLARGCAACDAIFCVTQKLVWAGLGSGRVSRARCARARHTTHRRRATPHGCRARRSGPPPMTQTDQRRGRCATGGQWPRPCDRRRRRPMIARVACRRAGRAGEVASSGRGCGGRRGPVGRGELLGLGLGEGDRRSRRRWRPVGQRRGPAVGVDGAQRLPGSASFASGPRQAWVVRGRADAAA